MAIHVFCPSCKTSCALGAKKCSKCEKPFGRQKKYRVCVSVSGKRATRLVDNLTLAREAEAAIKADLVRGQLAIKKPKLAPTLNDLWQKYFSWAQEHKKTWRDDQYYYKKHLEPRFGHKRLDAIAPIDIERMKLELKKGTNKRGKPYAPATIKHQLVLLKRLYNVARKWGLYIGKNPLESVEFPRLDNQKTEFLTDNELERLLAVLDSWPFRNSAAFVKFALFTGLRRGELFKLTWDDVDFDRGTVTVTLKGRKTETIPISDQALDVLRTLERTSTFVFPGKNGNQRTDFKGPWQRIRKAAGLSPGFRFHGLRHNFASALVSSGEDLYTVGKLLGHKQSTTTQRYAHLSDERVKEAAIKSGKLLSSKPVYDEAVGTDSSERA